MAESLSIQQDHRAKSPAMKSSIRFCVFLLPLFVPLLRAQIQEQPDRSIRHGTVNVILANGRTLVAVTDSMLTETEPLGPYRSVVRHAPSGVKLYKIDDRTIATMASLYKEPGPTEDDSLTASIPQMMSEFSHHLAPMYERMPFSYKAAALFSEIKFKLDRHLHAMAASNPHFLVVGNPDLMLELTIGGYDLDYSIKIAEITLIPGTKNGEIEYVSKSRPLGAYTPTCAFSAGFERLPEPYSDTPNLADRGPVMFDVRDSMFCEIAGLRDIPERTLASPEKYPDDSALQAYVKARSEGGKLSADELRALAVDLVNKTAADERRTGLLRVGGEVEVAVLSDGHMIEEPKSTPVLSDAEGSSLTGNRLKMGSYTCNSSRHPFGLNGNVASFGANTGIQEIEVTLTDCEQELDGIMFINSTFIDSRLTYSGKAPLFFPSTNVVVNTALELGDDLDLHSAAVHNLVCEFHWKSVAQGARVVKTDCSREGAQ